jgi:hypothetical protein
VDLLDQNFSWNQRKPDFLQRIFELCIDFISQVLDIEFELVVISIVECAVSSSPSQTSKVQLDLLKAIMESVSADDALEQFKRDCEDAFTFKHVQSVLVDVFKPQLGD